MDRITVQLDHGIARVALNRPEKRNALDMQMFRSIAAAQKKLRRNQDLRAVILTGNGEDFCSGLDIRSIMGSSASALRLIGKLNPWRPNLAQAVSVGWRKMRVPVIAAIHGRCWGGGLQIALGADFRILHPESSLSVMEGKWGLIPDMGGTLAMRDNMYRDQAMMLAMTARTIGADEAVETGLATMVSEDAEGAAESLAREIIERSPDAVAAVKRLYRKSWAPGGSVLARETLYQMRILAGRNQKIAVRRQKGDSADWRPVSRW